GAHTARDSSEEGVDELLVELVVRGREVQLSPRPAIGAVRAALEVVRPAWIHVGGASGNFFRVEALLRLLAVRVVSLALLLEGGADALVQHLIDRPEVQAAQGQVLLQLRTQRTEAVLHEHGFGLRKPALEALVPGLAVRVLYSSHYWKRSSAPLLSASSSSFWGMESMRSASLSRFLASSSAAGSISRSALSPALDRNTPCF